MLTKRFIGPITNHDDTALDGATMYAEEVYTDLDGVLDTEHYDSVLLKLLRVDEVRVYAGRLGMWQVHILLGNVWYYNPLHAGRFEAVHTADELAGTYIPASVLALLRRSPNQEAYSVSSPHWHYSHRCIA